MSLGSGCPQTYGILFGHLGMDQTPYFWIIPMLLCQALAQDMLITGQCHLLLAPIGGSTYTWASTSMFGAPIVGVGLRFDVFVKKNPSETTNPLE